MTKPSEIFRDNQEILKEYLYAWNLGRLFLEMYQAAAALDEPDLVNHALNAWWALPDHSGIRTRGFFVLCDIAEYAGDEDIMNSESKITVDV